MKPRFTTSGTTLMAFATPIHRVMFEGVGELNVEVAKRVLAMREKLQGLSRSNVGGWHSPATLLSDLGEPFGTQLGRMFVEGVKGAVNSMVEMTEAWPERFSMDAWANVNERGDRNSPHIHPGCAWSGVYYVATDKDAAGEIEFTDPRAAALMMNHPLSPFGACNGITVPPVPGIMLVFPSFVYHSVRPYEGTSPRISIAFNLTK